MEKLQQLYNGLKESGDVTVGFDEFASYYSNPENKQALYGGLKELGDVTVPFEEFDSYYFGGEKKKAQPQAGGGVLLPASSQQSGMVSGVTPTAKVSVAVESPAPPVAGAPGTPQAIAEQQSVDVAQAKEAKRQKTIATVANGLGNLAQLLEETGQPAYDAKSWKTQLEGTLSSPSAGKTQDERDVVALQRAYRLFTKSGLKRGGGGEGLYQGPFPAKMLIEKGIGTDRAYDISQAMEETWRALGEAEENLRKTDPQRWQQMMNAESDQYYKSRGISNGDKQLKFRALEKNDVGFKEDGLLSKEAMLRMQAKDWFDQAEKMTKSLGLAVDDPRRREMQAKANSILGEADKIRAARHDESLKKIDELKGYMEKPGITDFELKAARETLRRLEQEEKGIIDPSYQIAVASEANKDEIAAANQGTGAGKTPKERLDRYFSSLLYEKQRLEGRIHGDATPGKSAIEQVSGVLPLGREWQPDEVRYAQVVKKIQALAPVVYLNEMTDANGNRITREGAGEGLGEPFARNFVEVLTGGGGDFSASMKGSPQQRAADVTEAMLVAGLDPQRAMTTNYKEAIDKNIEGYGLGDPQYWMEQGGMLSAILLQSAPGQLVTVGLGTPAMIARVGNYLVKTPKIAKTVKVLMNAVKRGAEFEVSGQLSPNNYEELNFASGLLGGFGEQAGRAVLKGGEKLIGKMFGDRAQQAYGLISRYGAEKTLLGEAGSVVQGRMAMGMGETAGETVESLVHVWQQSEPGKTFWDGMKDEFGDSFDDHVKFVVSTFVMGMGLGGGHQGGIASQLMADAKARYDQSTPEERAVVDQVLEDVGSGMEEAHTEALQKSELEWLDQQEEDFKEKIDKGKLTVEQVAAVQQSIEEIRKRRAEIKSENKAQSEEDVKPASPETGEDVTTPQEGIEPETKKELTPEAQAAQQELERRAEIDRTMIAQGLGDRVNTAQSPEDRIREERQSLLDQQKRQALTDNEAKRLQHLDTVVSGLDQIAQGTHEVEVVQAETSTVTTESGETVTPVEGSDTKKKATVDVAGVPVELEFDLDELAGQMDQFEAGLAGDDTFVESPAQEASVQAETPVAPATEENPFGNPTPREAPKRRDQQIVDQINEFFSNLAGTIGQNAVDKIKEYADRIVADPKAREEIIKGLPQKWIDSIDQAVELQKAPAQETQAAPSTEQQVETPALEVNAVPVTQQEAQQQRKRKPNPDRKTKKKPAQELTQSEAVTESVAASIEAQDNPTPENLQREKEVEQRFENDIDTAAIDQDVAREEKSKKGKKQELPDGVEDQFVLANVRGDRTEYRKKDGVWEYRRHKRGTKVKDQQFVGDWEAVGEEDVQFVDRMSKKTELDREVLNSAKEWVATWGNFITGRGQMSGEAFSKVDAGLTKLGYDVTIKTFKLGMAVARALAARGEFTKEKWTKAITDRLGDRALPWLKIAWEQVTSVLPEGSTSADIQSNVTEPETAPQAEQPAAGEETKKKKKSKGNKTGTQKLMEKYLETASEALKQLVTNSPLTKSEYSQKDRFKKALEAVQKAMKDGTIGELMGRLKNPSLSDELDFDQFQRMALVRMYGAMSDAAIENSNRAMLEGDPEAAAKHGKDADVFTRNMTAMLNAFSQGALYSGRGGAASGIWQQLGKSLDLYALKVIAKANKEIMEKTKASNGKTLDVAIPETTENLNDIRKKNADEIAESIDPDAANAADKSKPKKKTTIAGMTREDARAAKKRAIEEWNSIHLSGTANAMLAPQGFAKTVALAKVGYYAMLEGSLAFTDWVANMKSSIPGVTDQELQDAWDADANGRTLSEESERLLRQRALSSITRTLASEDKATDNRGTAKEVKKRRDEMAKDLVDMIDAGETIDDFKKKHGLTEEEAESLADAIEEATPEALDKLAGKKAPKVRFAAESYLPKKRKARTEDEKNETKRKSELRKKIKEIVRDHFKDPDGRPLFDKLVEAGLDPQQATEVDQAVRDNAQRIMGEAVAGELDHIASNESKRRDRTYKPRTKGKTRSQTESLVDALVDGELNDTYIQGLLAHRYGLAPNPTPEQLARIRKIGAAIARTSGNLQKAAILELGRAMHEISPPRPLGEAIESFIGLIFAATLNSPVTMSVNLTSVLDHYFFGMVKPLSDPQQLADFFSALRSEDKNALLLNPIAKILFKARAGLKPWGAGWDAFWSAYKSGVISPRYDESILDADPLQMLPALERIPKGSFARFLLAPSIWNPFSHIFGKTIGRILTATDAATSMMYGDLEFIDALRETAGKGNKTWAQLKQEVGEYLSMKSQLWRDSIAKAEQEAAIVKEATGKEMTQAMVNTRAREIARVAFGARAGISSEELESVQGVAQYNNMTLARKGAFGKLADLTSKVKNLNWFTKIALFPFAMFTTIPGNFGDALLDNTPVWNFFRLAGISPTGLLKRIGASETSARLGDTHDSRMRRKQMEGAAFVVVLTMVAYAMLMAAGEDDDEPITTKEQKPEDSYKLFGISYKNFASLAPPFIMAKFLKDIQTKKDPINEDNWWSYVGKMMSMGQALAQFYTEQSFVKGIRDLSGMGQSMFRTVSGEGDFTQKVEGIAKNMVRPYLNALLKPLPTSQALTRFIWDVVDPHRYSQESMKEFFIYSIGLQHITNETKVDIFGEEFTSYPGDNVIPAKAMLDWATGEKNPNQDLYRYLSRTNTIIEAPNNEMAKFEDDKSPTGFVIRDYEPKEWKEYNVLSGKMFAESLRKYIARNPKPLEDVEIKGTKFLSETQNDIMDLWTKAKSKAKDDLFNGKKFPRVIVDKEANRELDKRINK